MSVRVELRADAVTYDARVKGHDGTGPLAWQGVACLPLYETHLYGADSVEAIDSIARAALIRACKGEHAPGERTLAACELDTNGEIVMRRHKRARAKR